MAIQIQLQSTNYNGQLADITFYPCSGGTISLGYQTIPFTYTNDNYEGTYDLFFSAFSQTCQLVITCPTPTPTITPTSTVTPTPTITPTPTLTPSSSPVPALLLNQYPGASQAFSLRKLNNTYTGNIIEVRRSSDNATQNIGFSGDVLDSASLLAFVGGSNGFVKTWYGQDGNNINATQITNANQPMIVSGGTIITQNNKPTILFDGSTSYLSFNGTNLANTKYSTFQVHSRASSIAQNYFIGGTTQATNQNLIIGYGSNAQYLYAQYNNDLPATIASFTGSTLELFNCFNISTGKSVYKSNVLIGSNINTTDLISFTGAQIGRFVTNFYYLGNVSELILYPTDQLSNRTAINTNINNYYTLY